MLISARLEGIKLGDIFIEIDEGGLILADLFNT